jgi:transposase
VERALATGLCSSSSAHRRFQEWTAAGVFHELWRRGLTEYDALKGIDWRWLAADGAMTKAPLGGENHGRNPTDRASRARSAAADRGAGVPLGRPVAGANRHDVILLAATLASIPVRAPTADDSQPQGVCLDKAYDITWVYRLARPTRASRPTCGRYARTCWRAAGARGRGRWVVERTHSWMNRFRGLLVRWEKRP